MACPISPRSTTQQQQQHKLSLQSLQRWCSVSLYALVLSSYFAACKGGPGDECDMSKPLDQCCSGTCSVITGKCKYSALAALIAALVPVAQVAAVSCLGQGDGGLGDLGTLPLLRCHPMIITLGVCVSLTRRQTALPSQDARPIGVDPIWRCWVERGAGRIY
jgi:hypothetical protein